MDESAPIDSASASASAFASGTPALLPTKQPASERCAEILCDMRCLMAITFGTLFIFLSIIVVGVTSEQQLLQLDNALIVVDTDAGTDDAMAIFLLLAAEKHYKETGNGPHVLAVTTVHGNTGVDNVVLNVLKVLQMSDRLDIPVHRGATGSILHTPDTTDYYGKDGMGDVPYLEPISTDLVSSELAAMALVRLANEHPGEISLLALGPLTNIALAARLDDQFLGKLKKLVILGGCVKGRGNISPGVEFNFHMDPEANYVVLEGSNYSNETLKLLSWEAVEDMGITQDWRVNYLGAVTSRAMEFLNQAEHITNLGSGGNGEWTFADPLAAALVLRPELALMRDMHHVVTVTQGVTRGGIAVDYYDQMSNTSQATILHEIDTETYKQMLLDYLAL